MKATASRVSSFENQLLATTAHRAFGLGNIFESHQSNANDLLTRLLGPYWEIQSLIFLVQHQVARAVRESEGFVFLVWTE